MSKQKTLRKFCLSTGLLALAAVSLSIGFPASQASAVSCNSYRTVSSHTSSSGLYMYTAQHVVPDSSGCRDINVTRIAAGGVPGCANFRVRFFHSNGRVTLNHFQRKCSSSTLKPIATHVMNGTRYRIETQSPVQRTFNVYD